VGPCEDPGDATEPLSHYWTASSHNSYIVGDQLTGLSSADMYRRQLLQGLRHLEVDCWDGRNGRPIVTHGHTLCTTERFEEVSKAVGECAFVTSLLPVSLSLEMHCSPRQQTRVAKMMVQHFESSLLLYEELVSVGRATQLSPLDLNSRILAKGKVKQLRKEKSSLSSMCSPRPFSFAISRCSSLPCSPRGKRATSRSSACSSGRCTSVEDSVRSESEYIETMASARRKLDKKVKGTKLLTDPFYAGCLSLRSEPLPAFLRCDPPKTVLPITSINEDVLLKAIGTSVAERNRIEGLHTSSAATGSELFEEMSRAIVQLAANPPPEVGRMQRRTAESLLRPFPLGLRFSGKNMSPQPCFLAGAQYICLNFSHSDLPVQLHFALFNGSPGFVLKPQEMRASSQNAPAKTDAGPSSASATPAMSIDSPGKESSDRAREPKPEVCDNDAYWPPPREDLQCTIVDVLSLHNLCKRGEMRPKLDGIRGACHQYHPELSGAAIPPNNLDPSLPSVTLSVHPIGGFCAICKTRPFQNTEIVATLPLKSSGMNAAIHETVHCIAAEPKATFLRVGVIDGRREVAYETAVLGRLRGGYRVLHLRSIHGTRQELCYLFVRISVSTEPNYWQTPRQIRLTRSVLNLEDHIGIVDRIRNQERG